MKVFLQIDFREGTHLSKKGILYHNVNLLSQHLGPLYYQHSTR